MKPKKKFGNCYEAAFKTLFHNINNKELRLVHGEVIGNKKGSETFGKPIGHAWIELRDMVIDPSDHFEWPKIVDRDAYYQNGQVKQSEIQVYGLGEAINECAKYLHYGPWDGSVKDFKKFQDAIEKL